MGKQEIEALLQILRIRFEENMARHDGISWQDVEYKLRENLQALTALHWMEETGGEPDIVGIEEGKFLFYDCVKETPKGRRSTCYDEEARVTRKKFPPETSAWELANAHGVALLTEEDYRYFQTLGKFDEKTSSWVATPEDIRTLGGAIFGDRRYNKVFIYHNGADSYYASRGFRVKLIV